MHTLRPWASIPLLASLYLVASFLLTGCNKASPNPGAGTDPIAAGKKVFEANNCAKCHSLDGNPGAPGGGPVAGGRGPGAGPQGPGGGPGGRTRGPDLAHVAANAAHTKQWLADHVRNPKSHKPQSNMPPFGPDRINDADLLALADYLASLK